MHPMFLPDTRLAGGQGWVIPALLPPLLWGSESFFGRVHLLYRIGPGESTKNFDILGKNFNNDFHLGGVREICLNSCK
jgi:hypothetical protein